MLEFQNESLTLPALLADELWKQKNVDEAAWLKEHPYLSQPKLWVMVERGDPAKTLQKVLNSIFSQLQQLKQKLRS